MPKVGSESQPKNCAKENLETAHILHQQRCQRFFSFRCAALSSAQGANATILGSNELNWGRQRKMGQKWGVKAQKIGRTRHANREIEQVTSTKHKYE